jgi:hypothetical protein
MSKTWKIILTVIILAVIAVTFLYFFYLRERAKEETKYQHVNEEIAFQCQTTFVTEAKSLDPAASYASLIPYKSKYFSDAGLKTENDKKWVEFVAAKQQYDACQLTVGQQSKEQLFSYWDEESLLEMFKMFEVANSVFEIFKQSDCGAIALLSVKKLIDITPTLKDADSQKLCTVLKNSGSDQQIKEMCGDNNDCYLLLKGNMENFSQIENKRWLAVAYYLAALRENKEELCAKENEIYPSYATVQKISCEYYFSQEDKNFCDQIYNDIKKKYCGNF